MIKVIDLNFQDKTKLIASFVIPTNQGIILIETGPFSCHGALVGALKKLGYSLKDVKKVLLTHIHLDHSGGAWALALEGAEIMVHPFGAPHLSKPEKLVSSATKIYGERMDLLWSDIKPIAEGLVRPLEHEEKVIFTNPQGEKKEIIAHHTPGHAGHHIAYQLDDKVFAGDVLGLQIEGSPVLMPSPPPEINFEKWKNSIELIQALSAREIYLTHFGLVENAGAHIEKCLLELQRLETWYKEQLTSGLDNESIKNNFLHYFANIFSKNPGLSELKKKIDFVNPLTMSHDGIMRYFKKFKGIEPAN